MHATFDNGRAPNPELEPTSNPHIEKLPSECHSWRGSPLWIRSGGVLRAADGLRVGV